MKITDEMIKAYGKAWHATPKGAPGDRTRAGLSAALKDVPDVEPFTFGGYPHHVTYLHLACGTVESVDPAHRGIKGSMMQGILDGECDCENTSQWVLVYVEKQA